MKYHSLSHQLKSIFLNGFFAIFPLSATLLVLNFLYKLSIKWLAPLRYIQPDFIQKIPGSELIMMILIILFIGVLAHFFIIMPLIHYIEKIIEQIPLVNSVYSAAKSIVKFFDIKKDKYNTRKVVLINFPRKEYFNIAFSLGPAYHYKSVIASDEEHMRVFLPTSPTPGTGYFFIIPQSEIIETSLTFEEGLKIIISCGVITPQDLPLYTQRKGKEHE